MGPPYRITCMIRIDAQRPIQLGAQVGRRLRRRWEGGRARQRVIATLGRLVSYIFHTIRSESPLLHGKYWRWVWLPPQAGMGSYLSGHSEVSKTFTV